MNSWDPRALRFVSHDLPQLCPTLLGKLPNDLDQFLVPARYDLAAHIFRHLLTLSNVTLFNVYSSDYCASSKGLIEREGKVRAELGTAVLTVPC